MPTLIVENGTKPANANSYCSIVDADNFHELMGNTDWADISEEDKTLNLIRATNSIDLQYGDRYLSYRLVGQQSLLFPRFTFVDRNSQIRPAEHIPVELIRAVALHALNLYNGTAEAYALPSSTPDIKQTTTKVGEIESSNTYFGTVDSETFDGYNAVELQLRAILKKKGTQGVSFKR